jgi:hypothetical protein
MYNAPPGDATTPQGHDPADLARAALSQEFSDVAVGHDAARRDRVDDVEHAARELVQLRARRSCSPGAATLHLSSHACPGQLCCPSRGAACRAPGGGCSLARPAEGGDEEASDRHAAMGRVASGSSVGGPPWVCPLADALLAGALLAGALPAGALLPCAVPADTLPADTLLPGPVPADALLPGALLPDTLPADTLPADTMPADTMPRAG